MPARRCGKKPRFCRFRAAVLPSFSGKSLIRKDKQFVSRASHPSPLSHLRVLGLMGQVCFGTATCGGPEKTTRTRKTGARYARDGSRDAIENRQQGGRSQVSGCRNLQPET